MGYHVFAIDYRGWYLKFSLKLSFGIFFLKLKPNKGYGDSTGVPTEDGVVQDVLSLYILITSYEPETKMFMYGHSLGTG